MYADDTLMPKEVIRLCALGTLTESSLRYGALVTAVRYFIRHVTGPSLDLMGESIELMRYEGLIDSGDAESDSMSATAELTITKAGEESLMSLLTAKLRPGNSDLNDLIIALKFRFFNLLDAASQEGQAAHLIDTAKAELARLAELKDHHAGDDGHLGPWLELEISRLESRVTWLKDFRQNLAPPEGKRESA